MLVISIQHESLYPMTTFLLHPQRRFIPQPFFSSTSIYPIQLSSILSIIINSYIQTHAASSLVLISLKSVVFIFLCHCTVTFCLTYILCHTQAIHTGTFVCFAIYPAHNFTSFKTVTPFLYINCTILRGRFKGAGSSLYLKDSCLCSICQLGQIEHMFYLP